jgi:hypothetical protein
MKVLALRPALAVHLWIALTLLSGLMTLPAPWGAAEASAASTIREPAARLQLVVKEITVHDDREGFPDGFSELVLRAGIWRCEEGQTAGCMYASEIPEVPAQTGKLVGASLSFTGDDGITVRPERLVPGIDDFMYGPDTSYSLGFAVYDGSQYIVKLSMHEANGDDAADSLGDVYHVGDTAGRGLSVGTFTRTSGFGSDQHFGDFSVTYEIRKAPLPDLRAHGIKIHNLVGTARKLVCMGVTNHEPYDADAFETVLTIDGAVPPGGRASAGHLKGGDSADVCVEVALPTTGSHKLAAIADASHLVAEFSETNNVYETSWTATATTVGAPGASASPQASPTIVPTASKPI